MSDTSILWEETVQGGADAGQRLVTLRQEV